MDTGLDGVVAGHLEVAVHGGAGINQRETSRVGPLAAPVMVVEAFQTLGDL